MGQTLEEPSQAQTSEVASTESTAARTDAQSTMGNAAVQEQVKAAQAGTAPLDPSPIETQSSDDCQSTAPTDAEAARAAACDHKLEMLNGSEGGAAEAHPNEIAKL